MPNTLQDYATLPLPLTSVESAELHDYEATIERGLTTFFEVGIALGMISRKKLYRATHRTFEDYCRETWNIDRSSAYRFMEAAEIKDNVSAIADIQNVGQARALEGLTADEQRTVVKKAVETAPNGKLTAHHIKDVRQVEIPMPEPEPVTVAAPVKQISVFVPEEKPKTTPHEIERLVKDWFFLEKNFNDITAQEALTRITQRVTLDDPEFNAIAKFIEQRRSCLRSDIRQACKNVLAVLQTPRKPEIVDADEQEDDFDGLKPYYDDIYAPVCEAAADDDEREPEAVIKDELELEPADMPGGIYGTCHFCGDTFPEKQLFSSHANNGYVLGHICGECAQRAARSLEQHIFQFMHQDRARMCAAGLVVFRVDLYKRVILLYDPQKGGTWKPRLKCKNDGDLEDAIMRVSEEPNTIFENRI